MKRCPKCGGHLFRTRVHVVQEWLMDDTDSLIEVITDCLEVSKEASNDETWTCDECEYESCGNEFEIDEDHPSLTSLEFGFCRMVGEGYISRNRDGSIFYSIKEPKRAEDKWESDDKIYFQEERFPFIDWTDNPWKVSDLLNLKRGIEKK